MNKFLIFLLFTMLTCLSVEAQKCCGIVNVLNEGLVADDPNFDNTPQLNKLIKNLGKERTLYFPSGIYYFNSKPEVIMKNLVIIGDHINGTTLVRNYDANDCNEALLHSRCTLTVEKIAIWAGAKTSHGGAIKLDGTAASASVLRDLYITGYEGGTFDIPITLCSTEDLGIRCCLIDNVEVFAATTHLVWLVNVRGLTARLNAYPAGGTVDHITIQGVNSNKRSEGIQIETRHLVRLYVYTSNSGSLKSLGTKVIQDGQEIQNGKALKEYEW